MIKWGIITIWLVIFNAILIPFMMYGFDGPRSFGAPFGLQLLMSPILGVLVAAWADEFFDVEEDYG